jgi:hypothetical protein
MRGKMFSANFRRDVTGLGESLKPHTSCCCALIDSSLEQLTRLRLELLIALIAPENAFHWQTRDFSFVPFDE